MVARGVDVDVHGLYRVGLWKNIKRGWGEFSSHTRFEVDDGSKIRFWHVWCEDQTLKVAFPELFRIAHFKDVYIADHLEYLQSRA
jgi:hypothetical protein